MKDRFHNPFDGSRKRSAPQPHKLEKDKEKYKPTKSLFTNGDSFWNDKIEGDYYNTLKLEEEE